MGEASQSGYDDLIRFVSENMNQKLVGCDPFDVGEIMKRQEAPAKRGIQQTALNAVEKALLDFTDR